MKAVNNNYFNLDKIVDIKVFQKKFLNNSYFNSIIILNFTFILIIFTSINFINNSLRIKDGLGFFDDIIFFSYFIVFPLIIILSKITFTQFSSSLKRIYFTIKFNENFKLNKLNLLLKRYEKILLIQTSKSKIIFAIFIICGIIWATLLSYSHWYSPIFINKVSWASSKYFYNFILRTCFEIFLFGVIVPIIIYKLISIIFIMNNICKKLQNFNVLRLRPINPDKAGGLGNLGNYSLKLIIILLPPIIPLFIYYFIRGISLSFILSFILYISILIFSFFYPLSGAHEAMKSFKEIELIRLSYEFNTIYDDFIMNLKNFDKEEFISNFEILERIKKTYQDTQEMPIWPFDSRTLAKFGSIITAILISIWLNWLFGKFVTM